MRQLPRVDSAATRRKAFGNIVTLVDGKVLGPHDGMDSLLGGFNALRRGGGG